MTRRLFHCISWVSVVLLVVTVVMWVRSFAVCDWMATERERRYSVGSSQGEIVAASADARRAFAAPVPRESTWQFGAFSDPRGMALVPPSYLGFGISSIRQTGRTTARSPISLHFIRLVMVPYWALTCLSVVLPAAAVWPDIRRRRDGR